MPNHIAYPSTGQFREVIRHVKETCKYHKTSLPMLIFTGTVKLHGTNHAVCYKPDGEIYTQSREKLTTFEADNAGSHAWTMQNLDSFKELFARIRKEYVFEDDSVIQVYGEFCGGSIQKGIGLSHLPKMFVVFGIRISSDAAAPLFLPMEDVAVYCAGLVKTSYDFVTWKVAIDFSQPEQAQQTLINITKEVERDCPVARRLLGPDFEGELIGEGVVWSTEYLGSTLRFKVKGEKHSSSKVKVLAAVDVEKMASIREFVASVVTESRLNQGLEHVPEREPAHTGAFLKWVMSDIYKEESDTMIANGFTSKEVSGPMSTAIRQWFLGVQ